MEFVKSKCIILTLSISMLIFSCSHKNIRFEDNCSCKMIEELDTTFYKTDTIFLFKEICSKDSIIQDFCEDFPYQNLFSPFHPGFIEIIKGLTIKECYGNNYFCFANASSILTYRRNKISMSTPTPEEIDSIEFLNSSVLSKHKILSDSFIFLCDKKFNKINHRPKNNCLRMQGSKFIITYMPSSKKCFLSFRNPDKHLQVDKVYTKINFIVDIKEIRED